MNVSKPIATLVGQTAITAAHMSAVRKQQIATRPKQEVMESIIREVVTSPKVQESLGKIINELA